MKTHTVDPITGYETTYKRKEQGVYTLTSEGKTYVGSTIDLHRRMIQHRHGARNKHSNVNLREVFDAGGEVVLDFIPIEGSIEDLRDKEAELIAKHAATGTLMNVSLDPNCPMGGGAKHSVEAKAKIAASQRDRTVSDETRRRQSEALMGHVLADETKAKIAEARTQFRVEIDGVQYASAEEACKKLGLGSRGLVRYRCNSPHYPNYKRTKI